MPKRCNSREGGKKEGGKKMTLTRIALQTRLICAGLLAGVLAGSLTFATQAVAAQTQNPNLPVPSESQPAAVAAPSAAQGGEQQPVDAGVFVFKKEVEEVVLHATVVDDERHLVPNLDRDFFAVFEDGVRQPITSFHREDVPVAMGIIIDNSGSMREKRDKVNEAVLNLLRQSNPQDKVFVVNFRSDSYLDQDFTSDPRLVQVALQQVSMEGATALYDAIVASSVHLKNYAALDNKVLLVITDGRDNASRETLQEARLRLQQQNGPTLYAIGLLGSGLETQDRGVLSSLAESTGGAAYFPQSLDELNDISRTIGYDIRSRYAIGYKSTNPSQNRGYRKIQVQALAPGYRQLTVRTRSGYYAGDGAY
jgi:VWFA-related protein